MAIMYIIHIFNVLITKSQSTCEDNNYPCRGDDDSWWFSKKDIIPTDSTIYGQLKLRDSMYMAFDIVNNAGIANQWENIFRIGFSAAISDGCDGKGSRYPALYMGPNDNYFHFAVSDANNCSAVDDWQYPENFGTYEMVQGNTYSVEIYYNEYHSWIRIKNATLCKDTPFEGCSTTPYDVFIEKDRSGTNPSYFGSIVSIFIGTDQFAGHSPEAIANVTLSNMFIYSYWSNDTSLTLPPTYAITSAPSLTPISSTSNPTDHPSSVRLLHVYAIDQINRFKSNVLCRYTGTNATNQSTINYFIYCCSIKCAIIATNIVSSIHCFIGTLNIIIIVTNRTVSTTHSATISVTVTCSCMFVYDLSEKHNIFI